MAEMIREEVERSTVYLTLRNKQRLAQLKRGEKTRKLNAALDREFEAEEKDRAFEAFMDQLEQVDPVEPSVSSVDAVRMLREGRDHDLADRKPTTA